ncbi:MAG: copper chaperone PCu(A)C [Lysobacter sp.]|nr:copper chaperone PCu(A)C [Lysobacter sp.]
MHNRLECFLILAALLCAVACATTPARAGDCRPTVREGWVSLPTPGPATKMATTMAGYGRIVNTCSMPVVIVGASSPSFGSVMLHETRTVDGISKMRHVPEVRLAPDGSVVFRPGGLHMMLTKPRAPLKPGSKIVVEFALKGGGSLLGEFEVRKPEI